MVQKSLIKSDKKIQDRINELYSEGKGYNAIAAELKITGVTVSHMSVKRYLDSIQASKSSIVTQDKKLNAYVRDRIFETGEQLRQTNEILWDLIKDAQTTRKFKLSVIKEIRETIKLAETMMNDFKNLNIQQGPSSKIELVQIVIGKLNELEESGDIKILNPAFKTQGNHQHPVQQDAEIIEEHTEEQK